MAYALAVAEEELEFEHRDLHVGNVLVHPTTMSTITITLNDVPFAVETHGVKATIIDFTLSRLSRGYILLHFSFVVKKLIFFSLSLCL